MIQVDSNNKWKKNAEQGNCVQNDDTYPTVNNAGRDGGFEYAMSGAVRSNICMNNDPHCPFI